MKILITQSNYIPWKGYFDSIAKVDKFIVYDEMQYTKRDWRNRNKIYTPQGLKWLSIPVEVKGKFEQKIKDTKIADPSWNKSHWGTLKQNYNKTKHFKEMSEWLEPLFLNCNYSYLTEVNLHFIKSILEFLKIETKIQVGSIINEKLDKTEKLVDICLQNSCKEYYTGPAAKNYMNESLFDSNNIEVKYLNYSDYIEYPQVYSPFEHGVSILDLIFNVGNDAPKYLKYTK